MDGLNLQRTRQLAQCFPYLVDFHFSIGRTEQPYHIINIKLLWFNKGNQGYGKLKPPLHNLLEPKVILKK